MNWIDEYLQAFTYAISASSEAGWFPFSWYRFFPYIADLDVARWHEVVQTARQKNLSIPDLAKTMNGPLTIRIEMHLLMFQSKVAELWETKPAQKAADFLNKICVTRCLDDPYGFKAGKIHTPEEVAQIMADTPWQTISGTQTRTVGNVVMAAIHLAYAYFVDYCYCPWHEALGPYELPNGKKLLIRKFANFRPVEVWPEGPFPKYKQLEIFTVYNATDIVMDQWSHISSQVNLAQNLNQVAIRADGAWISLDEVAALTPDLGMCAATLQNRWRTFDFETLKQHVLTLRWYMYSPILDFVGLPWQPTEEMRERIKGKELLPEITPELPTPEAAQDYWLAFADPRIHNFPKSYMRPR